MESSVPVTCPQAFGCSQERDRSLNICRHEVHGRVDRAVDVTLRRQMEDCFDFMFSKQLVHAFFVADVASDKLDSTVRPQIGQ